MPDEFIENDDLESILRRKEKIEADPLGATPNEVAAGLAEPSKTVGKASEEDTKAGFSGGNTPSD